MIGQLAVKGTQTCLVIGKGLVEDLPPVPAQGHGPVVRGPVVRLADVDADEDVDVLDIHLSCRLSVKSIRGQPVDRPAPAPTPALDLTRGGSFPLSAVISVRLLRVTFAPRIIYGQGQDTRAHSNWPGPGPPRTTNKVTGGAWYTWSYFRPRKPIREEASGSCPVVPVLTYLLLPYLLLAVGPPPTIMLTISASVSEPP